MTTRYYFKEFCVSTYKRRKHQNHKFSDKTPQQENKHKDSVFFFYFQEEVPVALKCAKAYEPPENPTLSADEAHLLNKHAVLGGRGKATLEAINWLENNNMRAVMVRKSA